jgi:hypothetical protein
MSKRTESEIKSSHFTGMPVKCMMHACKSQHLGNGLEGPEFEASLDYLTRPCLKKKSVIKD